MSGVVVCGAAGDADECLGITHLQSSQSVVEVIESSAVCGIDYLEVAGLIRWDDDRFDDWRRTLDHIQSSARVSGKPEFLNIGSYEGLLHERGMGHGRQSRLDYRIEWRGVTIGLASRQGEKRSTYNFYLKCPGIPCLLHGARNVRDAVHEMVSLIGGEIVDEWVQRVDYCADLPGVDVREELIQPFMEGCFISTAKGCGIDARKNPRDAHSFDLGDSSRLRLHVYDKKLECAEKHAGDVYENAMVQRRWHGSSPEFAGRVELQVGRHWLREFKIRSVDQALASLGSVVDKSLSGPRAFFRLTAGPPDRRNKHQSRVQSSAVWDAIRSTMVRQAGGAFVRLDRFKSDNVSFRRSYSLFRGSLARLAASLGMSCGSPSELSFIVEELLQLNDQTWADVDILVAEKRRALVHALGDDEFPASPAA